MGFGWGRGGLQAGPAWPCPRILGTCEGGEELCPPQGALPGSPSALRPAVSWPPRGVTKVLMVMRRETGGMNTEGSLCARRVLSASQIATTAATSTPPSPGPGGPCGRALGWSPPAASLPSSLPSTPTVSKQHSFQGSRPLPGPVWAAHSYPPLAPPHTLQCPSPGSLRLLPLPGSLFAQMSVTRCQFIQPRCQSRPSPSGLDPPVTSLLALELP